MNTSALTHGPWALLHSADAMRLLIKDFTLAFRERSQCPAPQELHGVYATRPEKTSKRRPLPFSDALLGGVVDEADKSCSEAEAADILEREHDSPWLWRLQYMSIALLVVCPKLRKELAKGCPAQVHKHWLEGLEARVLNRLLGRSSGTTALAPDQGSAQTPLMMVTDELIFLRLAYEML